MRAGVTLAILMAITSTAFAGGGFEIVIPGRVGVPIIINGVDASYAVVEGDWGLGKGTHVQPTVYAVTSIRYRASAIIIRVRAICRVTGVSRSNRRRTADCRSRPKAITNHGLRSRRRCRRSPMCPSIRRRSSTRRRITGIPNSGLADHRPFAEENHANENTYRRE